VKEFTAKVSQTSGFREQFGPEGERGGGSCKRSTREVKEGGKSRERDFMVEKIIEERPEPRKWEGEEQQIPVSSMFRGSRLRKLAKRSASRVNSERPAGSTGGTLERKGTILPP